jgi:hypothetical protein
MIIANPVVDIAGVGLVGLGGSQAADFAGHDLHGDLGLHTRRKSRLRSWEFKLPVWQGLSVLRQPFSTTYIRTRQTSYR